MTEKRKETLRALKFTLFSISAGVIQIGVTLLLSNTLIRDKALYWIPYLIGLVCSVIYNFTVNKKYTFHSAANVPAAMAKVFGFYCVFTPLSTLWVRYFTKTLLWNELLVQGGTMLINFVTEYLFTRYVVYRNQIDNDGSVKE
ncbi:MAG: GtrA family protein [Oscillospiraceae bacterium]|nr:GtrA family protein [Oscillospiraceae bacterium]MBR4193655.1 GtrA family protein [Oscillospiraceae bacterium]